MKKKATILLALIMAGILTAGILAGCGESSDNNGSDGEYSLQEDSSQSSTETPADNAGNSKGEENQSTDNETEDDSGTVFIESSEQPETVELESSIDADINEEIDNEALATWLATTEAPVFAVYIWDAESETAIQVENQESYTITEMDELVIRCSEALSPAIICHPYILSDETWGNIGGYRLFIFKFNDEIKSSDSQEYGIYLSIEMSELTENLELIDTDYFIEFILHP